MRKEEGGRYECAGVCFLGGFMDFTVAGLHIRITVNGRHSYHMEAQMYKDEEIEFRVFDYGYRYALRERSGGDVLVFLEDRKSIV